MTEFTELQELTQFSSHEDLQHSAVWLPTLRPRQPITWVCPLQGCFCDGL